MVLVLHSFKPNFFLFDNAFNLHISVLAKFPASLSDFPLMFNRRSSANAVAVVDLVNLGFIILLYCMSQRPRPHHETCGKLHVLLSGFSSCCLSDGLSVL